jgi:hypothetical protein
MFHQLCMSSLCYCSKVGECTPAPTPTWTLALTPAPTPARSPVGRANRRPLRRLPLRHRRLHVYPSRTDVGSLRRLPLRHPHRCLHLLLLRLAMLDRLVCAPTVSWCILWCTMNLLRNVRTELARSRWCWDQSRNDRGPVTTSKAAQDIQQKVEDAIVEGANCVVRRCRLEESIGLDWYPISARRICRVSFDLLLGTYDWYWM